MRTINFTKTAFKEYNSWRNENKKIQDKLADLIEDILRHPYEGIGKPEPLRHHLKGFWSRISYHKNILVYEITE